RMAANALRKGGWYATFGRAGARMETPGCSLCMGNQARVKDHSAVVSTSTRNFPHRMGDHCRVYLGSAEVAAVSAILGRIPTPDQYRQYAGRTEENHFM
ncbi:MAG: aconitate hydratase B, partial [Desulfobacterales bacterium]|nr:aconitate hydratase B [Desulfobacterales bacterium]